MEWQENPGRLRQERQQAACSWSMILRMRRILAAANLDGEIHDLQNPVDGCQVITYFPLASKEGWDVYRRSVVFLLITAVHELDASAEVKVDFSANKGLFIEVCRGEKALTQEDVTRIEERMRVSCGRIVPS